MKLPNAKIHNISMMHRFTNVMSAHKTLITVSFVVLSCFLLLRNCINDYTQGKIDRAHEALGLWLTANDVKTEKVHCVSSYDFIEEKNEDHFYPIIECAIVQSDPEYVRLFYLKCNEIRCQR